MNVPDRGQFVGSLIGQCLGDAMGFPAEGQPYSFCKDYVQDVILEGPALRARPGFIIGQYSDDSQLARELIISCVEKHGFDPGNYATRIAALFSLGKVTGGGNATWEAALRLEQGVSWDRSGTPSPSAGNGSAMRAGPIGLMYFDRPKSLISAAHDQSRITHQDIRCSAASVAVAGAVALALEMKPLDRQEFITELSQLTGVIDPAAQIAYAALTDWIELEPIDAVRAIVSAGYAFGDWQDWQGLTPFVTGTVLWSLYSFLHSPESYLDTIATAIVIGGDVDTTAAMAGAISGAYLGIEKIPLSLASHVTDQDTWGYEELVGLAGGLYDMKIVQGELREYPQP